MLLMHTVDRFDGLKQQPHTDCNSVRQNSIVVQRLKKHDNKKRALLLHWWHVPSL